MVCCGAQGWKRLFLSYPPLEECQLIANGISKINGGTALSNTAEKRIKANFRAGTSTGYARLLKGINHVVAAEVERCMHLWKAP